jgi:steroid 5-alpha reductase family enzyme
MLTESLAALPTYLTVGAIILALVTLLWLASLALKDSSIVDIFWGSGFVMAAWAAFFLEPGQALPRHWLLCGLVSLWGLRLALHILWRNWGKPEDYRYQAWRKEAGQAWWWRSFFKVFLLQGLLMWIIAAPLVAVLSSRQPEQLTWLDILAALAWLIGFFFEAAGDWQLARFKANPANKGKVLREGVWRFSRHPNYFGDALQWWAYYLLALAAGAWWTVFSPLLMTILLLRISGAALLEKSLVENKPGYAEYVQSTSQFIPWFPRRSPEPKKRAQPH